MRNCSHRKITFQRAALVHREELYGAALRLTRREQDAEDLLQETWARAYRSFDSFQAGTNCRAWLHRILKNTFINGYNRRVKERELMEQQRSAHCTTVDRDSQERYSCPDRATAFGRVNREVYEALEALPLEYRDAVVLIDMQDLSYKEAARAMGTPIGTVMSRVHRARRRLQDGLATFAIREGYAAVA